MQAFRTRDLPLNLLQCIYCCNSANKLVLFIREVVDTSSNLVKNIILHDTSVGQRKNLSPRR